MPSLLVSVLLAPPRKGGILGVANGTVTALGPTQKRPILGVAHGTVTAAAVSNTVTLGLHAFGPHPEEGVFWGSE